MAGRQARMRVDVIDARGLPALQDDWRAVYASDPDAHYFLSWDWMYKWATDVTTDVVVLAVWSQEEARHVAFFPVRQRLGLLKGGGAATIIRMSSEGVADCTGLLCDPERENQAIGALADHLRSRDWVKIVFRAFRVSDRRMGLILDQFPVRDFRVEDFDDIYSDGTDHSIFPYLALPGDWETYLAERLSKDTRRKVRRFMRQVGEVGGVRVTRTSASTLDRHLEILLRFWQRQWGHERNQSYLRKHAEMLRHCAAAGSLHMTVMWHDDRPVGALANLLDDVKKVMLFKLFGRDETFGNPSPGLILYASAIRDAIELGYRACDFLQGNHRFKYSFGAEDARVFQKQVRRATAGRLEHILDASSVPAVLRLTETLSKSGRVAEAEGIYRQILRIAPDSAEAAEALRDLRQDRALRRKGGLVPKIGVNEACPCGSGKKYKRCCRP